GRRRDRAKIGEVGEALGQGAAEIEEPRRRAGGALHRGVQAPESRRRPGPGLALRTLPWIPKHGVVRFRGARVEDAFALRESLGEAARADQPLEAVAPLGRAALGAARQGPPAMIHEEAGFAGPFARERGRLEDLQRRAIA